MAVRISGLPGMPTQHGPEMVASVWHLADRHRDHPRRDPDQRASDHRNEAAEESFARSSRPQSPSELSLVWSGLRRLAPTAP
jgi:hypothetical protein